MFCFSGKSRLWLSAHKRRLRLNARKVVCDANPQAANMHMTEREFAIQVVQRLQKAGHERALGRRLRAR